MRNNKEIIMAAISQNGRALKYASEQLQNDKELLLLLEKSNANIDDYYKNWYDERITVLNMYKKQDEIKESMKKNNTMSNVLKIKKSKKF
jgi:hypothetical protein